MISEFFKKIKGQKSWNPISQHVVRDANMRGALDGMGLTLVGQLPPETLAELKKLYQALHRFTPSNGGMFYSVYSKDLEYRRKVHEQIGELLKPVYDSLFMDYKVVLNSFIVKVSGPDSEFSLHQDSTSLDETRYSCLSVWIPLQKTTVHNGCMALLPYSHRMFSPYRGISFPQPFDSIQGEVRKYLMPLEMEEGEILLFDNRLVHNSLINNSGADRAVVMSGIFPKDAKIITCYKDMADAQSRIELIEQADDHLLTFENFFHDCTCRPETGHSVGFVDWDISQMKREKFLSLCKKYGLSEINAPQVLHSSAAQAIIGEPA